MIVCLNGKIIPERRAHISIHDHGFLYGDGLYETLRVKNGEIQFLKDHLRRLAVGRRRLRLRSPWNQSALASLLRKTVRANRLKNAVVRLTLTRGPGPRGFDPRGCKTPTLLITVAPFADFERVRSAGGMTIALVGVRRNAANSTPPDVKSISCLNGVLAKLESVDLGADEAVLLNERGDVAEGSVSTIFIVRNGVVATPKLDGGNLPGVTRAAVCRLLRRLQIPLRERRIAPGDLIAADEVFLTNALMGVMAVRSVVWKSAGRLHQRKFKPGSVAGRLMGS